MFDEFISKYSKQLILLGYTKPVLNDSGLSFTVMGRDYYGVIIIAKTKQGYNIVIGDTIKNIETLDINAIIYIMNKVQPKYDDIVSILGQNL